MTHFNTNKEEGATLQVSQEKAISQELRVLQFMVANPHAMLHPAQIWQEVFHHDHGRGAETSTPLTSVRRAITNLTNYGFLEKTEKIVVGPYGKATHLWKFTALRG